jgi:hypothetical protein
MTVGGYFFNKKTQPIKKKLDAGFLVVRLQDSHHIIRLLNGVAVLDMHDNEWRMNLMRDPFSFIVVSNQHPTSLTLITT